MATHSSILAWRIPWMEEPGGLQSMGSQELDTTERLNHHHHQYVCPTAEPGYGKGPATHPYPQVLNPPRARHRCQGFSIQVLT